VHQQARLLISTPNLNFVVNARRNAAFHESVMASQLSLVDGAPLVAASKLIGVPLPERVAGASLFEALLQDRHAPPMRVYFFGGRDGVAKMAHEAVNRAEGTLISCGFLNPGKGSVESFSTDSIVEQINAAAPDFLVVALGAEKGQAWIMRNAARLKAPVICHLGAVVNFVAGEIQRAPIWIQKLGSEWLWRIYQEPALYRRYLADGWVFCRLLLTRTLPLMLCQALYRRRQGYGQPFRCFLEERSSGQQLKLVGTATPADMPAFNHLLEQQVDSAKDLTLNCSELESLDSQMLGTLQRKHYWMARQGATLRLTGLRPQTRRLLRLHDATQLAA
jgi:N-acetylglucosaminyldiphosphoundecaprenol N-acetyl-beta-D-mannosaminyltransferase